MNKDLIKSEKLRVDKWLWHARFFKTRTLAAKIVAGGYLRVNSRKAEKSSTCVVAGDVLTFAQEKRVRVIKVVALGTRRGPSSEAKLLYEDLSLNQECDVSAPKFDRKGRPTKKDRRAIAHLRESDT